MKEINLEEIANTSGIFRSLMGRQMQGVTLTLMKEACNQVLDLAAENAELDDNGETYESCIYWVNKNSILQIKDWIK